MFQQNGSHATNAGAKSKKHLGAMSAQELKSELDAMFEREEKTGEKADPELIAEYLTALERLDAEAAPPPPSHDHFESSWDRFTKTHPDLFPPAKPKAQNWGKKAIRLFEVAVLAAAILIATAAAFRWPDYMAGWGTELFQIAPATSGVMELVEPNTDGYSSLAEAVAGIGMDDVDTPIWIPARYSIKDLVAQELPTYMTATAVYVADESELIVRISYYSETDTMPDFNFEKNDDNKQNKVTRNGITYHYTENYEVLRVTWKDGKCLYSLLGEVSREEMDQIINSIYGG